MPQEQSTEQSATARPSKGAARDADILAELAKQDEAAPSNDNAPTEEPPQAEPVETETAARTRVQSETPDSETELDGDTKRRLDMVSKAETRSKQALNKERQAFTSERQAFDVERKQLEADKAEIQKLIYAARNDPWGLLTKLGATDDDAEHLAQSIYARSPAAAKDPKNRAAVEAATHKRIAESRLETMERELLEMRRERQAEKQTAEHAKLVSSYLDNVSKAVTEKHPLTAQLIAKNPAKARRAFEEVAERLTKEYEEVPEPAEVLAAYEKQRRSELEELGIDLSTVGKATPAKETETTTKPSKTLGGVGGATIAKPMSKRMTDDELLKALEENRLE